MTDLNHARLVNERIIPLLRESWWPGAAARFDAALEEVKRGDNTVLLLFGADADGFSASYFAHRVLAGSAGAPRIETHAVWNFDYDFTWLPQLVHDRCPALVLCFDIPIIRETDVVRAVASRAPVAIYDHHIVPPGVPLDIRKVVFVNSRVDGPESCNYPASAFGAAFAAHSSGALRAADLTVLATGLIGDRAENRNPGVFEVLHSRFPSLKGDRARDPLRKFTHEVDALFRARVRHTPHGAETALAEFLDERDPLEALQTFSERFDLATAARQVQEEIDRWVKKLSSRPKSGLLCETLSVKTFSVGAIASALAARGVAEVAVIGFVVDDRVAFELRATADGPSLTEILAVQGREFSPLSAGGHPNAAGALIRKEDAREFERTLKQAYAAQGSGCR